MADVVGRAAALGLVLVVAWLDLGFYAVMRAAAGGALATLVVTWLVTRRLIRIRFRVDPSVWRALLKASLPLGAALAINQLYFRADTLIISLYEPYAQVGLYTLAYRILELTLIVGHDLPEHHLPDHLARRWPATSRACPRAVQALRRPRGGGGPAPRGRRAGAGPAVVELAGGERLRGCRRPRSGS